MTAFAFYRLMLAAAVPVLALLGIWIMRITPERLPDYEKIPRNRSFGAPLALVALLLCVPHARPICFDWMQSLLLPLAVVLPVLGYFYLDYLFARAVSGLAILFGYYFIHRSFDFHSTGAPLVAVEMWIFGLAGILASAKPCWMRDAIRTLSRRPKLRFIAAGFCAVTALTLLTALICHLTGGSHAA